MRICGTIDGQVKGNSVTIAKTARVIPELRAESHVLEDSVVELMCTSGFPALFTRSDGIEACWQLIDPVVQGWETGAAPELSTYAPGTWGPAEASWLLAQDGRRWRLGCGAEVETIHVGSSVAGDG